MANLRGFPPSNTISPSVRITEKDLSFIPTAPTFHRAALVGFASKGPINVPTLVRNVRQLHTTFGFPHPDTSDPYLIYAAEQFLAFGNELYIVRVADDSPVSNDAATIAETLVPAAGGVVKVLADNAGDYTFDKDSFFRWRLNGVLASKTLVVFDGTYSVTELRDLLNDQINPSIDGIEFYVEDNRIGVRTLWAFGPEANLEFVSVKNAMYGMTVDDSVNYDNPAFGAEIAPVIEWGTDMECAVVRGANSGSEGAADGEWAFSEDFVLQLVVDGTDDVNIDNAVQVVTVPATGPTIHDTITTEELVEEINRHLPYGGGDGLVPGGWVARVVDDYFVELSTKHAGRDARLLVKTAGNASQILGMPTTTARGTSPSGVTGEIGESTFGIVYGVEAPSGVYTFKITADSPGIEGNEIVVVTKNNIKDGVFNIEVYHNNVQMESWGNLSKDPSSSYYVETFLATHSDFIRVEDNTSVPAPPRDKPDGYQLSGGADGIPADPDDQDALIIGDAAAYSGLYTLSEPEQIDVDVVAIPGHSSTAVIRALISLCQDHRQDCMAIVDPPFGLSVREIVQWHNGVHPLNSDRFDSNFAALYWPWVKIFDTYNRLPMWVPPSGSILAVYARSDQMSAPWFPPAGETRGVVPGIIDVFSRPTLAERDDMYSNRNAINPIIRFVDAENFVVWGQKTLQRRPTALDRVNVRRMVLAAQKRIRAASRNLLFEPHDAQFRVNWISIADGILADIQAERGLTDYIIQADDELNPPDVIDRNEFRARIGVQPTRAAEFIFVEFSIHRTGDFAITD